MMRGLRAARQERRLTLRRARARRSAWLREVILWPETALLFGEGFWVRGVLRWWMPAIAVLGLAGAALSSDRAAFEAWQAVLAPFAISEDPAEDALRHREIAKELATARVPLAMLVALTAACGRMAAVFYCDAAASARR